MSEWELPRFPAVGRPVSGLERLWLVADRMAPPFVNQMVLEGEGWPIPPAGTDWDAVVAKVARAQPGWRGRLRGALGRARWQLDGPPPAVLEYEGSGWDGYGPADAPFLQRPLDVRRGPLAEIVLVRGSPTRIVLRTHHAISDGQGTYLLARALFAVLRGEAPPEAVAGPLSDDLLARQLGGQPEAPPPRESNSPTGRAEEGDLATTWGRRRVARPQVSRMLPRLAVALAQQTLLTPGAAFSVGIPVDLRPHVPGLSTTANLTGLVRLPVHRFLDEPDPVNSCADALRMARMRREELGVISAAQFAHHVPLNLQVWVGRAAARASLSSGRYPASAALSNLGRVELPTYSGGGFTAWRCFFIPPGNPGLPLFLGVTGDPGGIELCGAMPVALASHGRLRTLLETLAHVLATAG